MNKMYTIEQRKRLKYLYSGDLLDDPYLYGPFNFSKAEEMFWHHIRCKGIKLYPEFPVLNYFIDFANPEYKIGIEIDGKEWHMDKEKDKQRDYELNTLGWEIIRITGSQVYSANLYPEYYACESDEEYHEQMYIYENRNYEYIELLERLKKLNPKRDKGPTLLKDIIELLKYKLD